MGQIGTALASLGNMTLRYSEALLKDVKAEQFARFATPGGKVVVSNHPAFVLGHLSLYPARLMDALALPRGVVERPAGWEDQFKAGVECKDDATGAIYPKMDALTKFYFDSYRHVMSVVSEQPDSAFTKANPLGGRIAEMLPTTLAMASFVLSGHPMSHLGQISAWRRMMGMPSAM